MTWSEATYVCETCGARQEVRIYGGLAQPVLASGRRPGPGGEMIPTVAASCTADGGRLLLAERGAR